MTYPRTRQNSVHSSRSTTPAASTNSDSATSSESSGPIEEILYAFGPHSSFALHGPSFGFNLNSSYSSIAAFRKLELQAVYAIALTPHGSWICTGLNAQNAPVVASWTDESGSIPVSQAQAWADARRGYQELYDLLRDDGDDAAKLEKARFTAGPGGSWWAKTSTGVHTHNLPSRLSSQITQKAAEDVMTTHVALGERGSYVTLWSDGTRSWSLTGYSELTKYLDSSDAIAYISLSPVSQEHFLVKEDGFVYYSIDVARDFEGYLGKQTRAHMQRRAWRDGSVFDYECSAPGRTTQNVVIDADTNWTASTPPPKTLSVFNPTTFIPPSLLPGRLTNTTLLAAASGAVLGSSVTAYLLWKRRRADATARRLLLSSFYARRWFVRARSAGPPLATMGAVAGLGVATGWYLVGRWGSR